MAAVTAQALAAPTASLAKYVFCTGQLVREPRQITCSVGLLRQPHRCVEGGLTKFSAIAYPDRSSFAGRNVRVVKAAAAARKVAFSVRAERPLYFPGNPAPAYLDGRSAPRFCL